MTAGPTRLLRSVMPPFSIIVAHEPPPVLFFDSTAGLVRAAIAAPVIYLAVLLMVRISGKRTTSQMNNFDWILIVAMGSMIASPILLDSVPLAEAVAGILILLLLQFAITALSARFSSFETLVKARPTLLAHRGALLHDAMKAQRVSEAEVLAAVRNNGYADLSQVLAIVLESDARLSVIGMNDAADDNGAISPDRVEWEGREQRAHRS